MTYPDHLVTEASRYLLGQGIKVLQGNRLGATEREHVERLASYMELNGERTVADMGSGFGEVSRLLGKLIPQTHFWLVNRNQFQVEHSPQEPGFTSLLEDMRSTSIPRDSVELVMFNYSLCHVNCADALAEAARIARADGRLFVYDYERCAGNNERTQKYLAATFPTDQQFREACAATGWRDVETIHPGGDDSLFRDLFSQKAIYDEMFAELTPVIWKATKIKEQPLRAGMEHGRDGNPKNNLTLEDKIAHATALVRYFPEPHALMCSFGKDSMVLLHLIRDVMAGAELRTHQYPIPVIYHRTPYFPAKHEFADSVIRTWNLEVHDYPPLACGIKCKAERLELVTQYPFGSGGGILLPLNTEPPLKRREFVCGLEFLQRPKIYGMEWPWATVFQGHKDSDVDPYEGPMPLAHDVADAAGVNLVFPLRHWTDDDVWEYIERERVPFDKRRYAGRLEVPDKWLNPDYIHACTKCIDPREEAREVLCPKLNKMVPNVSRKVLRLDDVPSYINRVKEQSSHAAVEEVTTNA